MYSVLHCHFESALRALDLAAPEATRRLRRIYGSQGYQRSAPAERLTLLWRTVMSLTEGKDIFTETAFRSIVQRLITDMRTSQVEHVDLRIGPSTGRWRWMRSAVDGIEIFRERLAEHGDLSMTFLAGINMTKTEAQLDPLFDALAGGGELTTSIAGVDVNFLPPDLPKFDRYLKTLQILQSGGLKINIHLGELFGNEISRHVLRRITPDRIGHGVLLLDDQELIEIVKSHDICLDMCPTSNMLLGVANWHRWSPAGRALQLGIPVSINTDDPILFGTDIGRELGLSGLSHQQRDQVIANGRKYRHGRV